MNSRVVELEQDVAQPAITPVEIELVKDTHYLKKMYQSKAPDVEELPIVNVRCDRATMEWVMEYEGGEVKRVKKAIINNVTFESTQTGKMVKSCGAEFQEFVGCARGKVIQAQVATTTPSKPVKVKFDANDGYFYYVEPICGDIVELTQAAYLLLKERCQGMAVLV